MSRRDVPRKMRKTDIGERFVHSNKEIEEKAAQPNKYGRFPVMEVGLAGSLGSHVSAHGRLPVYCESPHSELTGFRTPG